MGAEIDRLEIEIEAQATKANNALDKLVGKLERLAGSLGSINGNSFLGFSEGISDISSAMQGLKSADIRKTDFNRLAKGIAELTSLDTSGLSRTANAMNGLADSIMGYEAVANSAEAVGNLAKGISKLGNKSVITAIDNMPKLATALNSMMNTLSKAPTVSSNLINMTTALAGLASQGSKVGSTTRSMTSSLNGYSASAQRASKSSKGLASVFGSLYANFFWVKRGADKLWKSIETSMDYVETLNYFDAAFGQVAESAVSQWESAGYDSADAYYKSFSDRAKELTSKMSGFKINENGTLTATGQPSLGIDPEKMMNYQATFGQMASSMGVASETSLKLSQALTEIGADLASVKNLDFDKVWNDMASGLAGMSRTLDKYGVNIRNVNLQQKLNELGIQANITALNQNDKALLRAIILLENTKYAWGDLAETINQPANQLRLIESNFQNLSRTIGNLFLPMVSKVLPYVNAMVIALQRLATWIGNLLGIDLSKVTSSVADSSFDFGSIADEAEEATGAVNKLQKSIRKFDELNVISSPSESSSGSGGGLSSGLLDDAFDKAYSEYQKAWDDAFNNMENRAQKLADKIEEIFAPVKKIFSDFFEGDFFAAGQDTSKLVSGIFDWMSDGIRKVDWKKIGYNIGEFLDGIEWMDVLRSVGNFLESAIDAAIELWKGCFSADPIATVIVSALGIAHFTGLDKILKDKIVEAIPTTLGSKSLTIVVGAVTWVIGSEVGRTLGKALFPNDKEYYDNFTWFGEDGFFKTISADWKTSLKGLYDMTTNYDSIRDSFIAGLTKSVLGPLGNILDVSGALNDLSKEINPSFTWFGKDGFFDTIKNTDFTTLVESFGNMISDIQDNDVYRILTGTFLLPKNSTIAQLREDIKSIPDAFNDTKDTVANWFSENVEPWLSREKWLDLGEGIKMSLSEKWTEFTEYWKTSGVYNWFTNDVAPWFTKEKWDEILSTIPDSFESVFENAVAGVKTILQPFLTWIEDIFGYVSDGVSDVKKVSTNPDRTSFKRTGIPQFETGGYVPTRFSMFMAGENGVPEIMGTVGGKTAVAGGVEITGIKDAVFSTAQQEIELLRQQNQLLRELVNKKWGITQDEIGVSARRYAKEEYMRTGNNVFIS